MELGHEGGTATMKQQKTGKKHNRWMPFGMLCIFVFATQALMRLSLPTNQRQMMMTSFNHNASPLMTDASNIISDKDFLPSPNANVTIETERFSTTIMPEKPRVYFIHVGKAGGMTLVTSLKLLRTVAAVGCSLNNKGEDGYNSCYSHLPGDSQLRRHTMGYFHMSGSRYTKEGKDWLLNNTNVFLFTVRDPIDRLISAYNYHRNEYKNFTKHRRYKPFYNQCFPGGLDAMVDTLRKGSDTMCTKLGLNVLSRGDGRGGSHFKCNYQYYKKYTIDAWPNHTVAVIRTEQMWEDTIYLDKVLGGTGEFQSAGSKYTHGSENYTASASLSQSNAFYLCCLIYQELEAYQQMILGAFNLNDSQKHETLSNLLNRCQIKASDKVMLEEPFSWEEFGQGRTCPEIKQKKGTRNYQVEKHVVIL